jgi:hypothetical protein
MSLKPEWTTETTPEKTGNNPEMIHQSSEKDMKEFQTDFIDP